MDRLIDCEPLIDECKECMSIEWNRSVYTTWAEAEEDFKARLEDAPTVDAVPVVRCCQCSRRYDADECPMCHLVEGEYNEYTADDGFCDRGERRTDNA